MIIFYVEKVLRLCIKEKEHFCSCFLAYRYVCKHILLFMNDSMKNLKDYVSQIIMNKLLCREIQRKSVEKRKYIILQVPNANIVMSVVKNKSLDEKLFMHP